MNLLKKTRIKIGKNMNDMYKKLDNNVRITENVWIYQTQPVGTLLSQNQGS